MGSLRIFTVRLVAVRIVAACLLFLFFGTLVSAGEAVWQDIARNRSVSVRVYFPRSAEKAPVILFSHGLGSSIESCVYLANTWTAQGFVCVFVQHPGCDENVWKGKIRILNELRGAYEKNWNARTRAEDLRFILDCLEYLVEAYPEFAERMDLDRIGVGGIDLGALAALLLAGQVPPDYGDSLQDPRIKAVLALSPPVRAANISFREVYAPIRVPSLFITGTRDDGIIGSTKAGHRRIPFDAMEHGQRYLIILDGGDHRMYGGRILSFLGGRSDERLQSGIIRSSTYFWLAVLQENPTAIQVLETHGWESLVGVKASIERKRGNPVTTPSQSPSSQSP